MEIGLTDRERDLVVEMLDAEIGDVRSQIHHSEDAETKECFREREELAKRLKARLEGRELEEPVIT